MGCPPDLASYGTADTGGWYGGVAHTPDAFADQPVWRRDRFGPTAARQGRMANPDLVRIDHGPDATLHIACGHHVRDATLARPAATAPTPGPA